VGHLNFFQLEVFLHVVEHGSFTKAGDRIGLTQSGVSHNITALETELGVTLLKRERKRITLHTSGKQGFNPKIILGVVEKEIFVNLFELFLCISFVLVRQLPIKPKSPDFCKPINL